MLTKAGGHTANIRVLLNNSELAEVFVQEEQSEIESDIHEYEEIVGFFSMAKPGLININILDLKPSFVQAGEVVSVLGKEFETHLSAEIKLNDSISANANVVSESQVDFIVPIGTASGEYNVKLLMGNKEYYAGEKLRVYSVISETGKDTHIHKDKPTYNTGRQPYNEMGQFNAGWDINRDDKTYLIRPDVENLNLPFGTAFKVYLHLYYGWERRFDRMPNIDPAIPNEASPRKRFELFTLKKNWGEGSKTASDYLMGQDATNGEATWEHYLYPNTWQVPGAKGNDDYNKPSEASVLLSEKTENIYFDVTESIVEAIKSTHSFYGFKLEESPITDAHGTKVIASYQHPTPGLRPKLVIVENTGDVIERPGGGGTGPGGGAGPGGGSSAGSVIAWLMPENRNTGVWVSHTCSHIQSVSYWNSIAYYNSGSSPPRSYVPGLKEQYKAWHIHDHSFCTSFMFAHDYVWEHYDERINGYQVVNFDGHNDNLQLNSPPRANGFTVFLYAKPSDNRNISVLRGLAKINFTFI